MAEMRNFEAEAAAAVGWTEHAFAGVFHHHHAEEPAPQTPATVPATMDAAPAAATAPPQGDPMITVAQLEAGAKDLAAKFEQIDKAALARLDAATANPETDDVLSDLAALAGLPIPAGTIKGMAASLKALLGLYAPEPTQAPAGAPVTA